MPPRRWKVKIGRARSSYTVEGIGDLIRFKTALACLLGVAAARAADPLPPGPGRETVRRVCSGCHALEVFAGKPHSRQEWRDIVTEMQNSGAEATRAEFRQIVDYLARTFPDK